jgi:DNA-binding MarR family transcriptional regulator
MSARHGSRAEPELGALLNAAASGLARLGDRVLKPLKVTSAQWKLLVVLARQGPARVSDLVARLQHDQAATSRLVSRLERAGLVRRRAHPDDARAGVVELTARGHRAYVACEVKLREVMGALEEQLGAPQQRALRGLLARFAQAVDAALPGPSPRRRAPAGRRRAAG